MKGSGKNTMASRSPLLLLAASALLNCSALMAQGFAPSAQIVDRINEDQLVTLTGNTHPAAKAKNDRGRVSADCR